MSKDKQGKTIAGTSGSNHGAGGAPGRTSKTQHLPPSVPRTSLLLEPDAMPDRPPDTRMFDDPFGLHLAAAERGPDGRQHTDALEQEAVVTELEWLIANADWRKLRINASRHAAKAPRARAQARRDGVAPDLSGVGSVIAVDQLAARVKDLQRRWSSSDLDDRKSAIKQAVDQCLSVAQAPPLDAIIAIPGYANQASFDFRAWKMWLRQELIDGSALTDADASELCSTLAHEARHAEQFFVVARRMSTRGHRPAELARELGGMHLPTVERAVALGRIDGPAQDALATQLEPSLTTQRELTTHFNRETGREALAKMAVARGVAERALEGMRAQPPTVSMDEAREACRGLQDQVEKVLLDYTIYLQFTQEEDSNEAGAGGALAFEALS